MTNEEIRAHKAAVDTARKEFLEIWERIKKKSGATDTNGVMIHIENMCWIFFLKGKGFK